MRGTTTDTFFIYCLFECLFDIRVSSKTKIVIAAKRQNGFIAKLNMHTLLADTKPVLPITPRRFAFS